MQIPFTISIIIAVKIKITKIAQPAWSSKKKNMETKIEQFVILAILRTYGKLQSSRFLFYSIISLECIHSTLRPRPFYLLPAVFSSFMSTRTILPALPPPPPLGSNQPREMGILFFILFHFTSEFTKHTLFSGQILMYMYYIYQPTDRIVLNPRKDDYEIPNSKSLIK